MTLSLSFTRYFDNVDVGNVGVDNINIKTGGVIYECNFICTLTST